MKVNCRTSWAWGLALVLAASPLAAQQPAGADAPRLASVTVQTTRDPVDKSYRAMLDGMRVFEQMHQLAPLATLRFKLLPRLRGVEMEGITLKVVGDSVSIPVPIAPDRSFTLPVNAQAAAEDASVMPNRKAHSMTWRTEVRTPGLPPNTRRLGDLRLECQVGVVAGLLSEESSPLGRMVLAMLPQTAPCTGARSSSYLLFADKPLFGVTLVSGTRRWSLPLADLYLGLATGPVSNGEMADSDAQSLLDRTFVLPLGDPNWPDDTLVELEDMAAPP